ncbi:glycosyltransferase family 2 protein [Clostridium butyricum]|jgi:glycosyltransferase involved in cell wall biosynthesis|uniref:Putative glycosyltransferase EpsJ n=1 Tax=Clostridium butyricum TaxID=1492 RepID=A0A6N3G444_CLOBU|nr:glycosyltransferase [Clostridium butyricum]MBO1686304.1 glycosyltransferase [Clostridium butyricum]MCQ2013651.1 glycosyltransferase [Clostridium butyricum]MCQ2025839.1 glycosyltransferase [Clostridium butyricum]MDU3581263.1 glycosyltransferase [Clostridium butyricum]MZI79724.1 glycosyltransferase [Clostridium butyricum]
MISVIVPAYNVEKYIEECLLSLVNQTYKDIEIIIINDGSTDKTKEIIIEYQEKYKNITGYNQKNNGVSVARNLGLKIAKGEYVIFVDPDDYLDSTMIEKMHDKLKMTDSDLVICGHNVFYDENPNEFMVNLINVDEDTVYTNVEVLDMMLNLKVKGYVWDKLFRRKMLIENKFNFEKDRYVQDWLPIVKQVCFSKKISFVNEPLYYYRQRKTSTIYKKNKKLIEDYSHTVKEINYFLKSNQIEINKTSKEVFDTETYYTICRHYYLYYSGILNIKDIYSSFNKSKYSEFSQFNILYILNSKINNKLKIKVILWKMRLFHLFFKIA